MMKPSPNATPISPKFWARFSGGDTSAMYAETAEMFAPVMPAITRPRNSHAKLGANAKSR